MAVETMLFDPSEYLDTEESQNELLSLVMEDAISRNQARLRIVARARGMTAIAREAGVTREALYKA